jgi:hypothetical protein
MDELERTMDYRASTVQQRIRMFFEQGSNRSFGVMRALGHDYAISIEDDTRSPKRTLH